MIDHLSQSVETIDVNLKLQEGKHRSDKKGFATSIRKIEFNVAKSMCRETCALKLLRRAA